MTKNKIGLLARLSAILAFIEGENGSDRPRARIRAALPEGLRITQTEILESFGVKRRGELPEELRHPTRVVARLHSGRDCYRTISASAEKLVAELENRFKRGPLEQRLALLGGDISTPRTVAELESEIARLREKSVEEAFALKGALDALDTELGSDPLAPIRFREMRDAELAGVIERLRYSLAGAASAYRESSKKLERAENLRRHKQWLEAKRSHRTTEAFSIWERKLYGRKDDERARRIAHALALSTLTDDRQAA
jgi:hypothetical protein